MGCVGWRAESRPSRKSLQTPSQTLSRRTGECQVSGLHADERESLHLNFSRRRRPCSMRKAAPLLLLHGFFSSPLHSGLCVACPISEAFQGLKWRLATLKCLHCCAWACNSPTVCGWGGGGRMGGWMRLNVCVCVPEPAIHQFHR